MVPLVCVVPSRFRRLSCGGGVFTSSALDEFSEWSAAVSKLRRGVLGSRARSEPKECWQMRSQLMGGRSGRANSVLNHMCGRGCVAGDVTVTSRRGCKGNTGRRSLQSEEKGLQALRRRVGRKTEKARSLDAENKELRARIDALEKKGGPSIPFGESLWNSKMRLRAAENWMNRRKSCRRSQEMSTDCRLLPKECRRASRSHCSTSCKRRRKGCQKIHSIQDKRKNMQNEKRRSGRKGAEAT